MPFDSSPKPPPGYCAHWQKERVRPRPVRPPYEIKAPSDQEVDALNTLGEKHAAVRIAVESFQDAVKNPESAYTLIAEKEGKLCAALRRAGVPPDNSLHRLVDVAAYLVMPKEGPRIEALRANRAEARARIADRAR